MRYFLVFLAILLIAFFQTTVVNFNFLLLLVLFSAVSFTSETALLIAFLAGFFLDLFSGSVLGFSSLGFLLPIFLLFLYRQRFSPQHYLVVGLFAAISYFLFCLITTRAFSLFEGIILVVLMIIFRLLFPFLFRTVEEPRIGLKI